MNYENAKDILPATLLAEVQKYAEGKIIYIPKAGLGEEWARIYLESLGETMPDDSLYFMMQLVRIPLRFIEEEAESGVNGRNADNISLAAGVSDTYEVPLIVFYEDRRFTTPYQREYLRTLMSEKRNSHYALVFARKEEYIYFWNNFGKNFQN